MTPKKRSAARRSFKNEEENVHQRVCANKRERQRTKVGFSSILLVVV